MTTMTQSSGPATVLTTQIDSPVGTLTMTAVDGRLASLHMDDQRHAPAPSPDWVRDDAAFAPVIEQLEAYFAGELTEFDIPLAPAGTPFQLEVWEALRTIPYGETMSYGELARQVGRPGASRAVGLANGRNPIGIIIPCHRVIGADGSLTGYGGGLERKTWLLDHEAGKGRLAL
jgi:methylated-DNA-[protein]-cysteine S-methyltransferase